MRRKTRRSQKYLASLKGVRVELAAARKAVAKAELKLKRAAKLRKPLGYRYSWSNI